jgi:uracil-DNA glycosylase family 4
VSIDTTSGKEPAGVPEDAGKARRHPLAECEKCGLNNDRCIFVPSYPPKGETEVVIVGEAPGVQEARRGVPFVGPSGKLLDAVLRGHGFSRDNAFITNACLCRPRDNATPTARDVAACSGRLRTEVTEATKAGAPIIALGNVAASAIFGEKVGITTFRVGPARQSRLYPGVRVVPTVHPAYVLRMPDAFPLLVDDIGKVKASADIRWEPPVYRVFDEGFEARGALRELRERAGDVVVDIEVGAEKDEEFIHPDQYQLLCVGLCYAPGRAIVVGETALQDGGVRRLLGDLLADPRVRVIAHNGKFDLAGLRHIASKARLGFDTMLASYAVDERRGTHGLKYLARERLGAPNYSLEVHKYISKKGDNFAHIPRPVLYKYNAYDVVCTYLLKDMYEERMQREGVTHVHDMLVRASDMLMAVEMQGLRVDRAYVMRMSDDFQAGLHSLNGRLSRWVGNARSPIQVRAALGKMGVNVVSTNIETLTEILHRKPNEEVQEFVELMMEHRKLAKLYGTYVKGILRRMYRGHVYPTFLLHGTTTGRLACRNPNLQNVPRDSTMRHMFIPSEGKTFVQADYKGAELRVMACEAGDQYLRGLFADGRDIHNEVATAFFGPGFTKDQRVRAKAVVFGLSYGREEYSLAQEYRISVQEARAYIDTFFRMIPDVVRWREDIKQRILHGDEDLTTAFGRHRHIWLVTNDNYQDVVKEGLAFVPQSTASDICLNAAIVLHEKYGLDIRLLVHDSILVETDDPVEVSHLMAEVMPEVAAEVYSDYVPFPVDVSTGPSWGSV